MKKYIFGLIAYFCLINSSYALENQFNSYKDAHLFAKENNKLLLVVLKTSWCKYCSYLESDMYKLNKDSLYIVYYIDAETDKLLANKFKYKLFPTSIILDCSGDYMKEISRKEGYKYEKYKDWLQSINSNYTNDN